MSGTVNLYLKELEILKEYQKSSPDLVMTKRDYNYVDVLKLIGIEVDFGYLPQGYLNLYNQDFIVEELISDGMISLIEPENFEIPVPQPGEKTLYADLVKTGLSTLEAVEALAQSLDIPVNQIGYAGLKDKVAVTSQRLSFRGVDVNKIKSLAIPGLALKNFFWGKGVLLKGGLIGNQFIILVRTPVTLGQGWLDESLAKFKNGFYNFYYFQRFGTPRLLGHQLGKLILQRNYQQAVETFLTDRGIQNVPLLNQIRQSAKENMGQWQTLEKIFLQLPYTCRLELKLVNHLIKNPHDFLGALKQINDQITLWVLAYSSYLFNVRLSRLINQQVKLPPRLPLLTNPECQRTGIYDEQLAQAAITDLGTPLREIFGHWPSNNGSCLTTAEVKISKSKIIKQGVVLVFQLPKGVYATTFLANLFSLYQGLPVPDWLDRTKYDTKKLLSLGSIEKVETLLGQYMFSRLDQII